ncbi:MAG: tRNA (adenosine(37)-N6)-threonylcarbamoyltransferase complex dimerization subunit type 1 TsaB [Sebaldella sp.]|nr:tRNA (adenosine(37)-N6)-threonylcarbamoyltransferase complex dimerization subunit type 1 TsaB [Sebaldella sp.]
MLILGISTTTKTSSVALYDEKMGLLGEVTIDIEKTHSKTLLDKIDKLLNWTSKTLDDINEVAVSIGPGSFTGVRIAIATVKGLFFSREIPIYSINELDALAFQLNISNEKIVSLVDSRKEKIYYCISKVTDNNLNILEEYTVSKLDDLLEKLLLTGETYYFTGDGTFNYKEKIRNVLGEKVAFPSDSNLKIRASTLILIRKNYPITDVYGLEPYYLEKSQAEKEMKNGI